MQSSHRLLSRRAALQLFGSSAGLALLAACTAAPATTPTATQAPTAAKPTSAAAAASTSIVVSTPAGPAATQPKLGGTLRMASTADVPNLDGHQRSAVLTDTVWTAFDRLIQYDANGTPQPMLAESWEVAPDFKQVKLNLRKGVQFHTGRELTSEDVKWNILRVRDPKVGSGSYVTWSNWFSTIDTSDKNVLILKTDVSRPTMFDFFEWLNIVDPVTMQGPDARTKAIGTGPFMLDEWKQGDSITFSKNKNYWQTGTPYFDNFVVKILEPNSALVQLESGAIDLVRTEAVDDIVRLRADPNYQAIQHPFPGTFYVFGFNITKPPFDNKLVRQAFNYAIDRQRYANSLMQGVVKPIALVWSPNSPAYDAARNASMTIDLEKAKSLLAQAGVSNLEADLLYIPSSYPVLVPFTQMYQADLAKIGVTLNIKSMDTATWLAQVNGVQYNGLYVSGDSLGNYLPATPLGASPALSPSKNNSGFKSDRWSQLVESISTETNPAKQKELYAQVNDFMLDEAWTMIFADRAVVWLARGALKNVQPTGRQSFRWHEVWLE